MDDDSRTERRQRRTAIPLGVTSLLFLAAYAVRVLALGLSGVGQVLCLAALPAARRLSA
jgi:voltage-gated potassium channel